MAKYYLKKSTDTNLHTTPVFAGKHYVGRYFSKAEKRYQEAQNKRIRK